MSADTCFICEEAEDGPCAPGIRPGPAATCMRSFTLGMGYATATAEGRAGLLRTLCLVHCHELQVWIAYEAANVGKDPGTWEPEPAVSGSQIR